MNYDRRGRLKFAGNEVTAAQLPFLPFVLVAVGVLLLAAGYGNRKEDARFLKRANFTQGVVVEIESGQYDEREPINDPVFTASKYTVFYRPSVSFLTDKGKEYFAKGKWDSDPNVYTVGQEVEVAYDPNNLFYKSIHAEEEVSDTSNKLTMAGWAALTSGLGLGYVLRSGTMRKKDILRRDPDLQNN